MQLHRCTEFSFWLHRICSVVVHVNCNKLGQVAGCIVGLEISFCRKHEACVCSRDCYLACSYRCHDDVLLGSKNNFLVWVYRYICLSCNHSCGLH